MLDVALPPHLTHDLFVCYAAADEWWVREYLFDALELPDDRVITEREFSPGRPRMAEFTRAVSDSRYTLLIFSPAFLADQFATFAGSIATFASVDEGRDRLIPLLLAPCEPGLEIAFRVSLDCTNEADWEGEIARLRQLLLMPAQPSAAETIECPYPGMVPFNSSQYRQFHGRNREIQDILLHLHHQRLLFVIGPSGSGKSSLVFAGVLPALFEDSYFPRDYWTARDMRPGDDPSQTLTEILDGALPPQANPNGNQQQAAAEPRRLLLVIDQLEELFTQVEPQAQSEFIEHIQALLQSDRCAVILTMRADFYAQLMTSSFWPVDSSQRYEVAPLRGPALRDAIQAPAGAVGVVLESGLVERLMADAASEPGSLPLIQETMRLLWSNRRRRVLTQTAYEQLGRDGNSGLAVAVATKADAAYSQLSPERRLIARRILLELVQIGEGRPDTRRQRPLSTFQRMIADRNDMEMTLEHLARHRLIITGDGNRDGQGTVDLAHEALIFCWPKLKEWLTENRHDTLIYLRLRQAVSEWCATNSADQSLLFGGSRLQDALQYVERHPHDIGQDERDFLAASEARELSRQRSRYLGQAAGGAVGAATGYGLAFTLGLWANGVRDLGTLLLMFQAVFPVGEIVGLSIGASLWWWRDRASLRLVMTVLIGAAVSGFTYPLLLVAITTVSSEIELRQILTGALLGAGIGFGVAAARDRGQRLCAVIAGGIVAMACASLIGGINWDPVVTIVAGTVLGALTGVGFYAAAVDEDTSPAPAGERT